MKTSKAFLLIAVSIHTLLPLFVGIGLFLSSLIIGDAVKHASPTESHQIEVKPTPSLAFRVISGIGLACLVATVGAAGQFLPCFITAVVLTLPAARLISISRFLYVIFCVLIGTCFAASWFYFVPGGLRGVGGMLTAFGAIGYLFSSICVSLLRRV